MQMQDSCCLATPVVVVFLHRTWSTLTEQHITCGWVCAAGVVYLYAPSYTYVYVPAIIIMLHGETKFCLHWVLSRYNHNNGGHDFLLHLYLSAKIITMVLFANDMSK
jgi:hypothetical protein